jgi:hypothetical protein
MSDPSRVYRGSAKTKTDVVYKIDNRSDRLLHTMPTSHHRPADIFVILKILQVYNVLRSMNQKVVPKGLIITPFITKRRFELVTY